MHTYFAYGSNMDQTQMRERCPDAELVGPAVLPGYRLAFTIFSPKRLCGCADIVADPSAQTYGLLYRLTDEDLTRLDTFEGVGGGYYRRIAVTVTSGGAPTQAETYEVISKKEGLHPSQHYLALLQQAAERFDFPQEYREALDVKQPPA